MPALMIASPLFFAESITQSINLIASTPWQANSECGTKLPGNIVVSDTFTTNKYAIVVAGKTRTETATAANALAGMV